MRLVSALVVVLVASLSAAAVGAAQTGRAGRAGSAAAASWKIEPTPNPSRAQISGLSGVSCPSRTTCTAVGSSAASLSSSTLPLTERWSGGRWRIQPSPAPKDTSDTLYGVSCSSARACVAVGDAFHKAARRDMPLVEAWKGRGWRVQRTPKSKSAASLYGVSCTSERSCVAVGFTLAARPQAVVERWNGRAWGVQAIPRPAKSTRLLAVSCPAARACTAVGYQQNATGNARPLAESWNGAKWRAAAVRRPGAGLLDAVSCTSATACTATGTDLQSGGTTLAERWNGKTWRVQATPNPANYRVSEAEVSLDGISCTSARACTASGDYSPGGAAAYFIESWNGSSWQLQSTPEPAGFLHGALLAVSCASARCTAVGAYTGQTRLQETLAMAR